MMGLGSFGLGLMSLPLLIAQWIGLLAMRRRSKKSAWWTMMTGTMMSTLGLLLGIGMMVAAWMMSGASGAGSWILSLVFAISSLHGLGTLVFTVGFAIHGAGLKREADRMAELEMIIAAQNEQLARHQG
jgi:hypothetical protein